MWQLGIYWLVKFHCKNPYCALLMFQFSYFGVFSKNINLKHNTFKVTRVKFKAEDIPDKSLVGGKVPKCITSQLAQLKILLLLYILFQLIKTLPNIKCMWTPLDGIRDWSIFSNSFFKYNSDNLPGLTSVPASSTHY